jgi:hypothetical protein
MMRTYLVREIILEVISTKDHQALLIFSQIVLYHLARLVLLGAKTT